MKPILRACTLAAALAAPSVVHAQGSLLRVTCEGNDVGAEVTVDGKFKGECPLDVPVGAGTVQLRVMKKVDSARERVFEQTFRMGDGAMKKVEAVLSAPRLNAEAQHLEDKRLGPERAEAAKRERTRQEALAAEPRRDEASLALLRREAEARVAVFKRSPTYKTGNAADVAEIMRILSLPIENLRSVMLRDEASIRAFIASDPFFETTGGSQTLSGSYKGLIQNVQITNTYTSTRNGRFSNLKSRLDNPARPAFFVTIEGLEILGGLVFFKGSISNNTNQSSRVELSQIVSVYGQPFPITSGKRFGLTTIHTTIGDDAGVKTNTRSCAASPQSSRSSELQAVHIACLQQRAEDPDYFSLTRYAWNDAAGQFAPLSE